MYPPNVLFSKPRIRHYDLISVYISPTGQQSLALIQTEYSLFKPLSMVVNA